MSFKVSDLIIESVLRDGLEAIRRDTTLLDDVFGEISNKLGPLMDEKYGPKELDRIKKYFTEKEIKVIQAYTQIANGLPAISIQLIENTESTRYAYLDDFQRDKMEDITDPDALAALIVVSGIAIDTYDQVSGMVTVPDSVDLSKVHVNLLLEDIDGNTYPIRGGIDNTSGQKKFFIDPALEPNLLGPALIKSSINFIQYEERGNQEDEKLLLGIHTEDRLLTIYLYILVKYFILSRKADLIRRGFKLATFSGSDFTRNLEYNEPVFSRWLTVSGLVGNSWKSDLGQAIDNVEVTVLVEKDVAGADDFIDLTVQPNDNEDE